MNLREELYPTKIKWTSILSNNNPSNLWVYYDKGACLNTNNYAFRVWIDSEKRYVPFMQNIKRVMWEYYINTCNIEDLKLIEFMEL